MTFLYLDSTHNLTLGLLDEKFQWLDFKYYDTGKTATELHQALYNLLKSHSIKLRDLEHALQIAGPGSYTGMRISDGLFQSLDLFGIKTNSFYHFEVPELLGVSSGTWISNAFKGEIFCYEWNEGNNSSTLYSEKEFISKGQDLDLLYTHHRPHFSPTFKSWEVNKKFEESAELVKNEPTKLFSEVMKLNLKRELFYYRAIEQEFKKPN